MDSGTLNLDELAQRLAGDRRRAWIRAVLKPTPDGAGLDLLQAFVVVGTRPDEWDAQTWKYEQCVFVAADLPARQLSQALKPGPQTLRLGGIDARLEIPDSGFSWQKKPSLAQYDELQLAWPSVIYSVPLASPNPQRPTGYLVDDNAPSFPLFGGGFQAFMYGNFAMTGASSPRLGEVSIRVVDAAARIRRIRFRPASVDVYVGGRSLQGSLLELNGETYRTMLDVAKPGRVTIPLPGQLPRDAWIWLKRGQEWLDFRSPTGWGGYTSPDVEVDQPKDLTSELEILTSQGEGRQLEYKRKLPDTRDEKRKVFKTVVAFANGDGGTVLFGVEDDGSVVGIQGKLIEQRRRLTDMLRSLISPTVKTIVDSHSLRGRGILILRVGPGTGDLHALMIDPEKPEFYVRRDGTTFYAKPEELTSAAQNRMLLPSRG